MKKTDLFEIMLAAYQNYGVNTVCLWDIDKEIETVDLGFRKKMTSCFDYRPAADALKQNLEEGII